MKKLVAVHSDVDVAPKVYIIHNLVHNRQEGDNMTQWFSYVNIVLEKLSMY